MPLPLLAAACFAAHVLAADAEGGGLRLAAEVVRVVAPAPPLWPSRFHVDFVEQTRGMSPLGEWKENSGSLHYDFENRRQLWVHGKGQHNNWCQCAGLDTDEQCELLSWHGGSNGTGAMYAIFRTLATPKCCKIGDYAHGFGPIRPDWLRSSNATLQGEKTVGNRICYEWASFHPGDWFMMVSDNWSVDVDGVPCMYEDRFKAWARLLGLGHTLTFDQKSYSTASELDAKFDMPADMDCEQECPNKEGWCKASKV